MNQYLNIVLKNPIPRKTTMIKDIPDKRYKCKQCFDTGIDDKHLCCWCEKGMEKYKLKWQKYND